MTLAIAEGLSVSFHYRMTLEDGTVIDDSFDESPMEYVHGSLGIVPGLERALVGLMAGDEREVIVAPEDGYGAFDPDGVKTADRSQFPEGIDLEPGMTFRVQGPEAVIQIWVKEVDGDDIVVSRNHPLAGETLRFQVRVIDVREAAEESAEPPST